MLNTKNIRNFLLISLVALSLAACETAPVVPMQAKSVPLERVMKQPLSNATNQTGQLVVTRDSGMFGIGLSILLSIDGQDVALFEAEETLPIPLTAGDHLVSIAQKPSVGASPREYEIYVKPGSIKFYRISVTQGGIVFQPTASVR